MTPRYRSNVLQVLGEYLKMGCRSPLRRLSCSAVLAGASHVCSTTKEFCLSRLFAVLMALMLVLVAAGLAPATAARSEPSDLKLYLRRATFDPLHPAAQSSSVPSEARETGLLLVQF